MARGGPDYSPFKPVPVYGTGYDNHSWYNTGNIVGGAFDDWGFTHPPAGHEYYVQTVAVSCDVVGVMQRVHSLLDAGEWFQSFYNGFGSWFFGTGFKVEAGESLHLLMHNADDVQHFFTAHIFAVDVTLNP